MDLFADMRPSFQISYERGMVVFELCTGVNTGDSLDATEQNLPGHEESRPCRPGFVEHARQEPTTRQKLGSLGL